MTLLWLALQGCGAGENHYWNEQADIYCDKLKKCDGEGFDESFDNKGDCKEATLITYDDIRSTYEECDYDAGAAGKCLNDKRKQNCDEYQLEVVASCKDVYDCIE